MMIVMHLLNSFLCSRIRVMTRTHPKAMCMRFIQKSGRATILIYPTCSNGMTSQDSSLVHAGATDVSVGVWSLLGPVRDFRGPQ